MNIIKKIVAKTTGYWLHSLDTLPVGADLFFDIHERIRYANMNVLFDVGANVGQTRFWLRFHEPKAKIYCFEPVQSTYLQLKQNSDRDTNCVLENIAFGEARSDKSIRLFEGNRSVFNSLNENLMNNDSRAKEEQIHIDTLDQYCLSKNISKIDLLKIDTEGYDLNVLRGAEQMMQKAAISMIYCESGFQTQNKRNTPFCELTQFLENYDYLFFGLYQVDFNNWQNGCSFGNALYVHRKAFQG